MYKILVFFAAVFLFLFGGEQLSHIPFSHISNPDVDESSGIIKSSRYPGVFWTHNDSGDKPRIYPLVWDETKAKGLRKRIKIKGAEHNDWEEIAAYPGGRLLIGDFGNNANARKDLTIYVIPEPDPYGKKGSVKVRQTIRFHFEDQVAFPPKKRNFDCEAMFTRGERIYLLTKHRSDTHTKLYKIEGDTARKLATFPISSKVTAADISPDGKQVAVLTYAYLWLFIGEEENIFQGKAYRLPIALGQCEAVCFDGDVLIITSEEGDIFRITLAEVLAHPIP